MATREPLSRSNTPKVTSPKPLKNGVVRKPSAQSVKSLRFARRPSVASDGPHYSSSGSEGVLTPGYDSGHEEGRKGSLPQDTAGLAGFHFGGQLRVPATEQSPLFSPSAPPQQPGDELLYNIASEQRPSERIFQKSFQDALSTTKAEMREISLAIWGCTAAHQAGSDLYALRKQAQALSEFEPSRTRTVGLVGDSGVGKSSLINSLLDKPDLARSNGDGGSSTCVVTEYRFRAAHYDEPFGIEVDYMNSDEVKELLAELVRTYRLFFLPAFQEVDTIEEQIEIRDRSAKAFDTLQAMFRNEHGLTKEFLLAPSNDEDASLFNTLQEWANKVRSSRPGGPDCRSWSATANDIDECVQRVERFNRDSTDETTPSLWPFVRIIRVYLRTPLLQTGLVLVDLPSLRDLNHARVRAIERYLRSCHEVFAVTTMCRALTDEGVRDTIRRNGRHRPLRIVCTKSENVNVREIERNSPPEIARKIKEWREQIAHVHLQLKRCEARRRCRMPGSLEEEIANRDVLEDLEFGLKKLLVQRQNQSVATKLIDRYAMDVQMGELEIFCVSNKDYFEHRNDEQGRAEPRLELSGILGLRRYCHSIPAEAQFTAAAAFIEHEAPALVGSLHQWSVAGSDEVPTKEAEELRQLMKQTEEVLTKKLVLGSSEIQLAKNNLNKEFAAAIVHPIREQRHDWIKAATEVSREWIVYNGNSFAAFCRKYGNHETRAVGSHKWNEDLIRVMRLQLESNWGFFQEWVEDCRKDVIDSVLEVFDKSCEPLRSYKDASPNAVRNMLENFAAHRDCIVHIIDTGFEDMIEGTSQIENDALYGHDSSYTCDILRPAYQACSLESGPNADARRKEIMSKHIQSCRLFPKLSTMVERNHRSFVRATFDAMIGQITRELDNFVRDLQLVAPEVGEVTEATKYPDFARRLRVRLLQANRTLEKCAETARQLKRTEEGNGRDY